ncbi:hypothetical protein TrRE_jg10458, partial [Triparma retinervis]
MSSLTEEQKAKIELSKARALAIREKKHAAAVNAMAIESKSAQDALKLACDDSQTPMGWIDDPNISSSSPQYPSTAAQKATSNMPSDWAGSKGTAVPRQQLQGVQGDPNWSPLISQGAGLEKYLIPLSGLFKVDEDYIQDDFNLTGLNSLVPYYDYALDMILDVEMPIEDQLTEDQQEVVESAAEMLYGLIHARYIVTNRGMHAMYDKYKKVSFGRCPRVFCQGQPVLPAGLSDLPRNYTVNVFCPKCHDLFYPKSTRQSNIDGAYFGTTFPHLYLMAHPEVIPQGSGVGASYVPKVYGFRISRKSVYYRNRGREE